MARGSLSTSEALVVSRPFWWVTTSVPFIVGALLAESNISLTLVVSAFYFLIPYNLLLYGVNDIFDYESDIRNERKTGVAHGKVLPKLKHPALWRWIIASNVPFILYLLLAGNLESAVFLFMILFMAIAYSAPGLRYKEIPFIDSLTSAFHYTSPFLFGLLLFHSSDLWVAAFAGFYFWAAGNHAFGAIQDIIPDRRAGIRSIATILGAHKTIGFSLFCYGLAIIAPILGFGLYGLFAAAAIAPYAAIICWAARFESGALQFRKAWHAFLYLNYAVGGIGSLILIYLYNK
jgi:4-hydroxybenzoate polyprenyltransferase